MPAPIPREKVRRSQTLCFGLVLLFIVQGSLVPFDFTLDAARHRAWLIASSAHSNLLDVLGNIFLYMPAGFLLCLLVSRITRHPACPPRWRGVRHSSSPLNGRAARRHSLLRHGLRSFLSATFLCGSLSFLLESVQVFSPSRISSLIDVTSNVIGAGLGACIALSARWAMPVIVGGLIEECRQSPLLVALKGYVFVLAMMAALPFSFSFDVGRLREAAKNAVLVPFGRSYAQAQANPPLYPLDKGGGSNPAFSGSPLSRTEIVETGGGVSSALEEWRRMKCWARWAAECASFVVVGLLLREVLRAPFGFGRRGSIAMMMMWLGAQIAVMLSLLQFTVVDRGFDATDVFFRMLGLSGGVIILWLRPSPYPLPARERGFRTTSRSVTAAFLGAALFIVYTGTIPWRFVSMEEIGSRISWATFMPLMPYFETRYDRMFGDLVEKVSAFAVLGAIAKLRSVQRHSNGLRDRLRFFERPMVVCMGTALFIEVVQLFIPVRLPGVTDVCLAGVGCILGTMLFDHVHDIYGYAIGGRRETVLPRAGAPRSPGDLLLESLSEPYPQAPSERIRTPSPSQSRLER